MDKETIAELVERMPKVGHSGCCALAAQAQREEIARAGWRPIRERPKHCSSHNEFVDECQDCRRVTIHYLVRGKYHPIDWDSFDIGQQVMLEQGYRKLPGEGELQEMLNEIGFERTSPHMIMELWHQLRGRGDK